MCGIVGLMGSSEASREAFLGLTTLQHRGQDAAGILSYDQAGFHRVKNLGLVESVFSRENMAMLTGSMAIGHARYATIGRGDIQDVQPFVLGYPYGIGLVHNGNIVNAPELVAELKQKNRRGFLTSSDSEVVLNLFAEGLARAADAAGSTALPPSGEAAFGQICSAVQEIFSRLRGSYSIITVVADVGMVAFRDPNGIRPLVWGKKKTKDPKTGLDCHMLASESVALSFMGYELERSIEPGEVIFIDNSGNVFTKVLDGREARHCMFEWVYFASPESVIDGVPVYGTRIQLGKALAKLIQGTMKERKLEADIVVPVPETSRIAAIALSEELGIPYREVLIKNRYIKRTFILDSQEKRQSAVNLKLSPVRSEIQGKRVILVDDSIVRGTTSKKIIELVRQAGASEVYFVSTCPPIQHPCFFGIDFPMQSELLASGRSHSEIEKELGADAVIYQDVAGLEQSIALAGSQAGAGARPFKPCMACLDGKYPMDVSSGSRFSDLRAQDRASRDKNASKGRV